MPTEGGAWNNLPHLALQPAYAKRTRTFPEGISVGTGAVSRRVAARKSVLSVWTTTCEGNEIQQARARRFSEKQNEGESVVRKLLYCTRVLAMLQQRAFEADAGMVRAHFARRAGWV